MHKLTANLVLEWNLDRHLRSTASDMLDLHLPADRCRSLCDRPRDEPSGHRICPVVADPHHETVVPVRKSNAGASGLRVPPNVAQSFHDHLKYLGDEPVVDVQIAGSLNMHGNMCRLGKG